jgi:hypothetical protein
MNRWIDRPRPAELGRPDKNDDPPARAGATMPQSRLGMVAPAIPLAS